ncbi:hypothetical protein [Paludisphaera sp.]|uniref:hypothetical protein n=1 Tax=Paludisphaera sp. TaxID=2017432 RepID=UPI00301D9612
MTKRRRASWAATALALAAFCGCGGSDGLAPGMPDNLDMSKVSDPMAGSQMKTIGKEVKTKKAP